MSLHYVELHKGFPQAIWEFQYCTNLSGVRLGGTAPWWVRSDLAKVSSPVIRHVRKIINIFMYIIFINIINSEMWIVFHIDVYTPEASEAKNKSLWISLARNLHADLWSLASIDSPDFLQGGVVDLWKPSLIASLKRQVATLPAGKPPPVAGITHQHGTGVLKSQRWCRVESAPKNWLCRFMMHGESEHESHLFLHISISISLSRSPYLASVYTCKTTSFCRKKT